MLRDLKARWQMWRYMRKMPKLRDGYRTFALSGDKVWGDSITWTDGAPDGHEGRVHGWVPVLPQVGDRVAVRMQSGRTAAWVFAVVKPCDNPRDMFFGVVKGPIGYMEDAEAPATAAGRMGEYV